MASAQNVVQAYYEAINTHDPDAMVQCCAEDIEVTFPEAKRNWKSRATAHEKFRSMFKNLPGFAAKWKFEDEAVKDIVSPPSQMLSTVSEICDETKFQEGRNVQIVKVVVHFTAESYDAHRKMIYTVREGQICRIDHEDI